MISGSIEVTAVDEDSDYSSKSSGSSISFEQVDSSYSGSESDSPNDQLTALPESKGIASLPPRMKGYQHPSFRDRKKKEMRHGSFTYKQVSDNTTPTAHRKQLFSKRSACKLTVLAMEESVSGKHVKVNDYYFLKTLGKGSYGEVRLATKDLVEDDFSQHTSRYAIKVMKRSMFEEKKQLPVRRPSTQGSNQSQEQVEGSTRSVSGPLEDESIPSALLQEINIMKRLAHPNLYCRLTQVIS